MGTLYESVDNCYNNIVTLGCLRKFGNKVDINTFPTFFQNFQWLKQAIWLGAGWLNAMARVACTYMYMSFHIFMEVGPIIPV